MDESESMAKAQRGAEKIRLALSVPYVFSIHHEGWNTRAQPVLALDHGARGGDDPLVWANAAVGHLIRLYQAKNPN
jgi:hypothetical protein